MEEVEKRELQLCDDMIGACKPMITTKDQSDQPPLDLSLSMGNIPTRPNPSKESDNRSKNQQVLRQEVAEQVRLAALEQAYADRMRELARKELQLAEKEFARARLIWKHAREEVEKAESMKMAATRRISSTCIEITCQACRQHFRP